MKDIINGLNNTIYNYGSNGNVSITPALGLTDPEDLNTLAAPFISQPGGNVTINTPGGAINYTSNSNGSMNIQDIGNNKTPFQTYIPNSANIITQIVQPPANPVSSLTTSGLPTNSKVTIGESPISGTPYYYGTEITNIINNGLGNDSNTTLLILIL